MGDRYQLAQVNIALPREPLDSALLADFLAGIPPINALADRSPGFVWRLQTEDGDALAVRAFGDPRIIVNLTVWESVEALADFVYRGAHTPYLRQRRRWFHQIDAFLALWWVPTGHRPTVVEAEDRVAYLGQHGPSPHAFTFQAPLAPPNSSTPRAPRADDLCPA